MSKKVLIIVLLLSLASAGLWLWQNRDKQTSDQNSSTNQSTNNTTKPSTTKQHSLLDGKVTFEIDESKWKTATGGYFSKESGRCGQSVTVDTKCLDHVMLIPSDERFTNPDQFHVDIGVLEKSTGLSSGEWYRDEIFDGVSATATSKDLVINGNEATRYRSVDSIGGSEFIELKYAIAGNEFGVLLSTSMFNKSFYSYEGFKDYRELESLVNEIAKSISIN